MVTRKAYAKLNISLKVVGESGGYHNLDSIVVTVDKFDVITVKKRKDNKILVTFTGKYGFIPKFQEETNAYKTAKLFMETFSTSGVDVTIQRNIPTGSGMGGSSADIAGVLSAMKGLFKLKCDLKPLADALGSDAGYLLKGGWARLKGRGTEIEPLNIKERYYFVAIYGENGVATKECFSRFDSDNAPPLHIDNDKVISALIDGDLALLKTVAGNDLYLSASSINSEISQNLSALHSLSPPLALMSGSGSTVFAVYDNYDMALWAESKLKKRYGDRIETLSVFTPETLTFFDKLFGFTSLDAD